MDTILRPIGTTTLREATRFVLLDIGVDPSVKGYNYLRTAIELAYNKREYLEAITKDLYPSIAEVYATTPQRVERSIRHAIEKAFNSVDNEVIYQYFGNVINPNTGKVTNSTFIATIVENIYLRMEGVEEGGQHENP